MRTGTKSTLSAIFALTSILLCPSADASFNKPDIMDFLKSAPQETEEGAIDEMQEHKIELSICDEQYTKNIFTFRQLLSSDLPSNIAHEINQTFEGLTQVVQDNINRDLDNETEFSNVTPENFVAALNQFMEDYINAVFRQYASSIPSYKKPTASIKINWQPVEGGCLTPIDEARRHERSPS